MEMSVPAPHHPISQQDRFGKVKQREKLCAQIPAAQMECGSQAAKEDPRPRQQGAQDDCRNPAARHRLYVKRTSALFSFDRGERMHWPVRLIDRSHLDVEAELSELNNLVEQETMRHRRVAAEQIGQPRPCRCGRRIPYFGELSSGCRHSRSSWVRFLGWTSRGAARVE